MQRKASLIVGFTLIVLALLALAGNLLVQVSGLGFIAGFRAWPIAVIGAGLLFCIPPFLFRQVRGLGGLFIPGITVLTTGLLLFITSVTGQWHLWTYLWPFEVLSVALGLVVAAIFLRVIWLLIPASIIGINGLVLLFCALTSLWASWAVLWAVEPLSIGLPLLVIGAIKKNSGVVLAGIILSGFAGVAFAAMSTILVSMGWVTGLAGPVLVLGLGAYLLISSLLKGKETKDERISE